MRDPFTLNPDAAATSVGVSLGATAALLVGFAIMACDLGPLTIRVVITDLEEAQVSGARLWAAPDDTSPFEEWATFRFDRVFEDRGVEYLEYARLDAAGIPQIVTTTPLQHHTAPGSQIVWLVLPDTPDGTHIKASTYNGAGESPLSTQSFVYMRGG